MNPLVANCVLVYLSMAVFILGSSCICSLVSQPDIVVLQSERFDHGGDPIQGCAVQYDHVDVSTSFLRVLATDGFSPVHEEAVCAHRWYLHVNKARCKTSTVCRQNIHKTSIARRYFCLLPSNELANPLLCNRILTAA